LSSRVDPVDVEALESEAQRAIAAATTLEELDEARVRYLGRKSQLKLALREVRERETGMTLNTLRERLELAVEERRAALERERYAARDGLDVTLPGTPYARGHLHLITQIIREVEEIFLGMGYEIVDSREVETAWHNFDALNQPLNHPSRSPRETFYVHDRDTLLRAHTSTGQIRVMESRQPPIYIATLGRVYRRDTPSPKSTPVFHQVEALAVDRGITLADLKGTMLTFFRAMFGEDREVRVRTSFFPFTEPSVEFDVTCFLCAGAGCAFCKHSGWFEMGGAGWVDPAVFENVGYDPNEWSGFAWGLGLDRIAAQRHGVPDIRMFWDNDLRFLRQF
jgi:phenylalanyl-tRNA synthetase alpha chain